MLILYVSGQQQRLVGWNKYKERRRAQSERRKGRRRKVVRRKTQEVVEEGVELK